MKELNKELAKLLGLCWHDLKQVHPIEYGTLTCMKCGENDPDYPDFTADAGNVQLLRLMMKHKKYKKFREEYLFNDCTTGDVFIPINYITDTTGKLAKAALEWIEI
jgi:uncharacterized lipoprotein NlpE involved in copper resistance